MKKRTHNAMNVASFPVSTPQLFSHIVETGNEATMNVHVVLSTQGCNGPFSAMMSWGGVGTKWREKYT